MTRLWHPGWLQLWVKSEIGHECLGRFVMVPMLTLGFRLVIDVCCYFFNVINDRRGASRSKDQCKGVVAVVYWVPTKGPRFSVSIKKKLRPASVKNTVHYATIKLPQPIIKNLVAKRFVRSFRYSTIVYSVLYFAGLSSDKLRMDSFFYKTASLIFGLICLRVQVPVGVVFKSQGMNFYGLPSII